MKAKLIKLKTGEMFRHDSVVYVKLKSIEEYARKKMQPLPEGWCLIKSAVVPDSFLELETAAEAMFSTTSGGVSLTAPEGFISHLKNRDTGTVSIYRFRPGFYQILLRVAAVPPEGDGEVWMVEKDAEVEDSDF